MLRANEFSGLTMGSISDTLTEMRQDLQSSISYAGGKRLSALRKVDYVLVRHSIFNGDML